MLHSNSYLSLSSFRIWHRTLLHLIPAVIILLLSAATAFPDQVTLAWDPNSEPDLAGYKIHYGLQSGNYTFTCDAGNATSCTIGDLQPGITYYFAATAYSTAGLESTLSPEISYAMPPAVPDPPPADDPPVTDDTDADGISDTDELNIYFTDPNIPDTDGDGISDGLELTLWGSLWNADVDGDGWINLLDPDSDNDGSMDGAEFQSGTDPADAVSSPAAVTFEAGETSVDHNWKRINFTKTYTTPVVVARSFSGNDPDPAVVRIRNVDESGFEIRVQEWDYLDGLHGSEAVGYLVMESGSFTLPDGTRVEAGMFPSESIKGTRTFHQPFNTQPIVMASIASYNEEDAVTLRLDTVTPDSFDYLLQEQESNIQKHVTETIACIAWEPFSGMLDGIFVETGTTGPVVTHQFTRISFSAEHIGVPVFLATMQTTGDKDPADVRWDTKTAAGVDLRIEEERSKTAEVVHKPEDIGYILLSFPDGP